MGYSGRLEDGDRGGAVLGTARRPPRVTAPLVEVVERIGTRKPAAAPGQGRRARQAREGSCWSLRSGPESSYARSDDCPVDAALPDSTIFFSTAPSSSKDRADPCTPRGARRSRSDEIEEGFSRTFDIERPPKFLVQIHIFLGTVTTSAANEKRPQ